MSSVQQWSSRATTNVVLIFFIFTQFIRPSTQQSQQPNSSSLKNAALIAFGDSTLDVGNNNNLISILKATHLPYGRDFMGGKPTGRFSNGRLPIDFLASRAGMPVPLAYLDPNANGQNLVYGINFASAGSGFNDITARIYNVIPLSKQLQYFQNYRTQLAGVVGVDQAASIISNAMYIVSTGANDIASNYFLNPNARSKLTPQQYVNFILQLAATFLENLYQLGARKLTIAALPPIGCLPFQRTLTHLLTNLSKCVETENNAVLFYNAGLQGIVDKLRATHTDYNIVLVDTYQRFMEIYQNPGQFGIEVVTRGCCDTGTVEIGIFCNRLTGALTCPDASKYMFWDGYHPTEVVYSILSEYFYQAVLNVNLGR